MSVPAAQDGAVQRSANFYRETQHNASDVSDGSLIQSGSDAGAFSNEQIAQAVVAIMRGPSGDGTFDPILASGIAGQLAQAVNQHLRGVDPVQLAANAMFKQLVSQRLDGNEADRKIESATRALRNANVSSADNAAALAQLGERAGLNRGGIDRADRATSSNRFDALGGGERLSQGELQNMAAARALAHDLGMTWALNNPELLKLGAGAIKTLHDAGVQKERFERITGDTVGFRASTAVDIAAFAKRHKLTPAETNNLYDKISDGVEIISGGNKGIQRELDEATKKYVTGADTPEARQELEKAYQKHADTAAKKKAAELTSQALIAPTQRDNAAVLKADIKVARADVKEKTTEDLDLYAQAAAPGTNTVVIPKQTNAGTVVPGAADKTKIATIAPVTKPTVPKLT